MSQKNAKQYSLDDIASFRSGLEALPDVTSERLHKKDVLESLKDSIQTMTSEKGYTLSEVHEHLKKFGFEDVTLKDLKELSAGKKPRRQRSAAGKSSTEQKQQQPAQVQTGSASASAQTN